MITRFPNFLKLCTILIYALMTYKDCAAEPSTQALEFVQNLPFLNVKVGNANTRLMFDSGGQLGVTLSKDVITAAGNVKLLDHTSKHGDAAGHVFEVRDILAEQIEVGGVVLKDVPGNEHYKWGLEASSDGSGPPKELVDAQRNGTIGLAAFGEHALMFDYASKSLTIFDVDPQTTLDPKQWWVLPLSFDKRGPLVNMRMGSQSLTLALDTGASANILMPAVLGSKRYQAACKHKPKGGNYCGHLDVKDFATPDGVSFGTLGMELVELKGVPFDGLLGAGFFGQHKIIFDVAHGHLWVSR